MQNKIDLTTVGNESRVSSELIAESIGTTYKATNYLITKHKARLKSFGLLPFKKDAKSKKIPAYLNENQAIFLMTLSKNTEQAVDFKQALVKEFSKLRKQQAIIDTNHAKVEWQQNRTLGKLTHRSNTDTLKEFIAYATAQGSSNYSKHAYSMIARMVNKALAINNRDEISEHELHLLSTAELITERVLLAGMRECLPYKNIYQLARHEVGKFAAMVKDNQEAAHVE